jgi:galacturan 1,4-alpha-galacturonidase
MYSRSLYHLLAFLGSATISAAATTCEVAGGTSDDGPAIKAALASCNNGGTVVLDKTYTIATVLETTNLTNIAIELSGTIILSPGTSLAWERIIGRKWY